MPRKRARHEISEDGGSKVRESRMYWALHDENASTEEKLYAAPVQQCSFFESAAVHAWYNGSGEPITTVPVVNPALMSTESTQEPIASFHQPAVENFARASRENDTEGFIDAQRNCSVTDLENADDVLCETELVKMDSNNAFAIPTLERLDEIEQEAISAMVSASEEMEPCCVCELSCPCSDIIRQELTDQFVQLMRHSLSVEETDHIPDFILSQYDASPKEPRLKGLLLFPEAIHTGDGVVKANVCRGCNNHITHRQGGVPPTAAIANGNYIGHVPSTFEGMTRTDEQVVALVLPCVSLSVVTGGRCRTIKSHHYVVQNTEGPILEMLPRDLAGRVRVTMVGSMMKSQVAACKKRYEVNLPLCKRFLGFLHDNNLEYRHHQQVIEPPSQNLSGVTATSVIVDRTSLLGQAAEDEQMVCEIRDNSTYSNFGSRVEDGVDVSTEETWIGASSMLLQQSQQDWTDVLVRKSNAYVPTTNWSACTKMFPMLFPGGCGGPSEPRKKHMSVRKWILRCLQVHGHRFEKHYAFMLLAFDYLAAKNARETLFVKMNVSRTALEAAEVSQSTVRDAIEYFKHLAACRVRGVKPRSPDPDVQHVIDLRKGLRVPESAFFGSNKSRMRARHDLFGMLKRFGPLQIFFTVSPDSAGTYNIAIKSGGLPKKVVDEGNVILLPNRAERKAIAAAFPVECARYFLRVMDTVIDVMLGWNQKACAPRRRGGIFGIVRAFGAAVETQRAGDLHAHFAVWLHGFPPTSAELGELLGSNSNFQERLVALADRVLTTKPPCIHEENKCPRCSTEHSLDPVISGVDAFRRPFPGAAAPTTARCSVCDATLKDKDLIDAAIEALAEQRHVPVNTQWKDYSKCRPPVAQCNSDLESSLVIRDVQVHYWNHCKSCFKATVRTPQASVCRFFKPEEVHLADTCIDDSSKLRLHRPIGCEYVNAFNPVIARVLKCNHDAQFVLSTGAKDTAAYVIKYCFKSQNPVENQVELSLAAFAKAVSKTNMLPADTTAMERGCRILGSMLYTVTNGQEVAGPMAALYVLKETPFWFSHQFMHMNLRNMLRKSIDYVEINVSKQVCGNESLHPSTITSDSQPLERYWKRQRILENVPFIDICEKYEYTGKKTLSVTAVQYTKLEAARVLVLCGEEIPDISSDVDPDVLSYYYRAMLTLFKPHRQQTLLNSDQSPLASYQSFLMHGDSRNVQRLLQFEDQWKDYYRAQKRGDENEESAEAMLLRSRAPPTSAWTVDNSSGGEHDDVDDFNSEADPENFLDIKNITEPDYSTAKLVADATAIVDTVPNLVAALRSATQKYIATTTALTSININFSSMNANLVQEIADNDELWLGTQNFIEMFPDAPTRLERLKECFYPVPYDSLRGEPRWTPSSLPQFPTIAMVSEACQLNFWQHAIFEVCARHLLYAYSKDIEEAVDASLFYSNARLAPYEIKPHLISYLGGEAGTGKSTVVDALLTFSKAWGRTDSVETMAFTGVAAINIKGKTMHSARNLKINGAEPNAAPTTEMKIRFSRVVLVIIDEISITAQSLLGGTDAASRSMSATPEKFMGGKHVLLIGDWMQLPPVGGAPCFQEPSAVANRLRHAGYALYMAINFVVFLTRNMRARFDPYYTQLLDSLRWGRLSNDQLQMLNTRVHAGDQHEENSTHRDDKFYSPVVVCTNKLRCGINHQMLFGIARARGFPVYECLALPSSRSRSIVEHLANADDNLTDRMPMKLLFFVGMPVMVTRKHPTLIEADVIANGVIATIIGIYPLPDIQQASTYDVGDVVVHRLRVRPDLLLLNIHGCNKVLVGGFPEGVIGLPPLKTRLRLTQIPNLSQASVTVEQFAVVPAFACTTEKLQGQTCHDGITVTPLDRRRAAVPHQTLYVALSRSVSLAGLTLTEPITPEYLAKFQPTEATENEMQRLIELVSMPPYITEHERSAFNEWKSRQGRSRQ